MAGARVFFKRCPKCGNRFEVKETRKELEDVEVHTEESSKSTPIYAGAIRAATGASRVSKETFSVYMAHYRHTYTCKQCGHEWSETEVKETRSEGGTFPSSRIQPRSSESASPESYVGAITRLAPGDRSP